MYESPITMLVEQVATEVEKTAEGEILKAISRVGVTVDKYELFKALAYDRDMYDKGYNDGVRASKWISTNDRLPICGVPVIVTYDSGHVSTATLYCLSNGRYVWENARGYQHHTDAIIAWQNLPMPYDEG